MAHTIANASLEDIQERLANAPAYHPLDARTFADWSMEAGDIIKVKRGEEEYSSPVHSTKMVWKGALSGMTISSTGTQERGPVATESRKKYGRGGAALRSEIEIYKEFTSSDGMLHSAIYMSESRLVTQFDNAISDVHSTIQQTAENISSAVYAANSTLYSYIDQTATNIRSTVNDINEDLHSEIEQTKSMIRSAVWTANSLVYSYVDQTASYILSHVGERSGAKVFMGEEPVDDPENPLNVGDLWIEGTFINTWDDTEGIPWVDYDPTHPEYDWTQLKGQKVHVYQADGEFHLVHDDTTVAEYGDIVQLSDGIRLVAYREGIFEEEYRRNVARLDVRADHIESDVQDQVYGLQSNIYQTASQIRAEVHASSSNLYSYIEQTATSIVSVVADVENGLQSEILQTSIQIMLSVNNSVSELRGSINVESNRISLVVEGTGSNAKIKPASIVQSINNGSSSIVISANHINLDGYVKATDLTSTWLSSAIASLSVVKCQALQVTYPMGPGSSETVGFGSLVKDLQIVQDGNTYKLQKKIASSGTWTDVGSFSRATSLSGAWSGAAYTVTASPQGNTISVSPFVQHIVPQGQPGTSMNSYVANSKGTAPYYDTHGNSKPLYLVKDSGYVKIRDVNSASGGNTYAQIQAGCTDISLDGWTDTYSGDSNRYTILNGSGSNAVLAISFKLKSNDGYEEEQVWADPNGNGANRAITMAYRNGYAAGGGGAVPSYSVSFDSAGTFSSGTSPSEALSGWNPRQISGVPNSQNQTYRYIKFTIDGKRRSFYFT